MLSSCSFCKPDQPSERSVHAHADLIFSCTRASMRSDSSLRKELRTFHCVSRDLVVHDELSLESASRRNLDSSARKGMFSA
jgi:hypothetical protein